jgi:hypothetical protein
MPRNFNRHQLVLVLGKWLVVGAGAPEAAVDGHRDPRAAGNASDVAAMGTPSDVLGEAATEEERR